MIIKGHNMIIVLLNGRKEMQNDSKIKLNDHNKLQNDHKVKQKACKENKAVTEKYRCAQTRVLNYQGDDKLQQAYVK